MVADELKDLFTRIDTLECRLMGGESVGNSHTSVAELQQILDRTAQQFFASQVSQGDGQRKRLELSRGVLDLFRSARNPVKHRRPLALRATGVTLRSRLL